MQVYSSEGAAVTETRHQFWTVWQYVKPLRRWIKCHRRGHSKSGQLSNSLVSAPLHTAAYAGSAAYRKAKPPPFDIIKYVHSSHLLQFSFCRSSVADRLDAST